MSDINLFGLEAGPALVAASYLGSAATASGTVSGSSGAAAAPSVFTGRASGFWQGIGGAGGGNHGIRWAPRFVPVVTGEFVRAASGASHRVYSAEFGDSENRAKRAFGGTASVYRISAGEMSLVRKSRIVEGNWARWYGLTSASSKGATSGFQFRLEGYWRADGLYHFGVAAVDATYRYGAIGSASYAPANLSGNRAANTETTFAANYSPGGALPAPANVTVTPDPSGAGLIRITWDAVPGAVGYVPFVSYNEAPANIPAMPYLDLEDDGGPALLADDLVILSLPCLVPTQDMLSQRVYSAAELYEQLDAVFDMSSAAQRSDWFGYAYRAFDNMLPNPDPQQAADYYLEIDFDGGHVQAPVVTRYWHHHALQAYYDVLDPAQTYRFEVWVWADRAAINGFSWRFDNEERIGFSRQTVSLVPGWQKLTFSQRPTGFLSPGTNVGKWVIDVDTTGGDALKLRFAGARLFVVGEEFEGISATESAHWPTGSVIRTDALVKKRPFAPTIGDLTGPPGQSCFGNTIHGQLQTILNSGNTPQLQIEWYHGDDEFRDLVAFLAAPVSSDHPMALKRALLGREAPWIDAWGKFYFELSNEAWNFTRGFWTAPYNLTDAITSEVYSHGAGFGMLFRRIALAMRSSPYWSDKIRFVIGGRPGGDFGPEAAARFKFPVETGPSLYMSGWDVGVELVQDNDAGYKSLLAATEQVVRPTIQDNIDRLKAVAAASEGVYTYGENLQAMSYESGPGYQLSGLNGASVTTAQAIQQEVVMKSRACATGTLDTFMTQARLGTLRSVFFTLGSGDYWSARAPTSDGGHPYVPWQLLRIVQAQMGESVPYQARNVRIGTVLVPQVSGGNTAIDALYLHTLHSSDYPGRVMLMIGNRSIDTTWKPTICTPFLAASSCRVWANVGDYREHNRFPAGKRVASPIAVVGSGQSGSSLAIRGLSKPPAVGDTFTIASVGGLYTVTGLGGWDQSSGTLGINPPLASSPADGATVTWGDVTDGYHSDPFCKSITIAEQSVALPPNLARIVVDDALGAGPAGLAPGNCILIQLDGVV